MDFEKVVNLIKITLWVRTQKKMVKHTEVIIRLFECFWLFCGVGT